MSEFSTRLKNLRIEKGLTQKEVARDLDMTFSALSQYENGKRIPKNDILIKIAAYFNASIDYLLGLDDNLLKSSPYQLGPVAPVPKAATSNTFTYDEPPQEDTTDTDIALTRTRILSSISRLPKDKQLEVLTAIELLLGSFIG